MASSHRKEIRKLTRVVEQQGWRVELGDHIKWFPPDGGRPVFCGSTPSDNRSMKNLRAELRRRGAQV